MMTAAEKVAVAELIEEIAAVVDRADDVGSVVQALGFCLIAKIQVACNLTPRGAVDYCAEHFRRYGQIVMS